MREASISSFTLLIQPWKKDLPASEIKRTSV